MEKVSEFKIKNKFYPLFTDEFRKFVLKKIGKLDTATSFMYLYRRFGEPTFTNKDEYKILYDYRFKHDDLLVTVHASYYEHVYFSIHVPQKRINAWRKERKEFYNALYNKITDIPFMPYSMLPYSDSNGLTKHQNKRTWRLLDRELQSFFSIEDIEYISSQLKSENPEHKVFEMLRPFEKKMCENFRKRLSKTELNQLNNFAPKISEIEGLEKQCNDIINDFKRGCYVRDVAINIKGYEGKNNVISEYI